MEPVVYTPVSATANLRRSAVIGAAVAAVAIVLTALDGHPMMGVFGGVGIALGAINTRLLQRSVVHFATVAGTSGAVTKKRFGVGVMGRLGLITLAAIVIGILDRPDGLGVFVGLAVFQLLMLIGAAVPVFRSLRPTP